MTFSTIAKGQSSCSAKIKKSISKTLLSIENGKSENMSKHFDSLVKYSKKCSDREEAKKYIKKVFKKSLKKRLNNKVKHSKYVAKFRDVTKDLEEIELLNQKYHDSFGIKKINLNISKLKSKLSYGKEKTKKSAKRVVLI